MLEARAEKTFTRERCKRLKAGGLTYASFGLESLDDKVLGDIDKGTKVSQYAGALTNFYQEGIATGAMGFFDFPTEDYAAAERSLENLKQFRDYISDIGWGSFALDKGSQVYRNLEQFGIERVVEHEEHDLALSSSYIMRTNRKTEEQAQENLRHLDEFLLESGFSAMLDRPFIASASNEASSLLLYSRFGPGAVKDFCRKAQQRRAQRALEPVDHVRRSLGALSLRYPVREVCDLFRKLHEGLAQGTGSVLFQLGRRLPPEQWLLSFDNRVAPGESRAVMATPEKVVMVTDDILEILGQFAEPKSVQQILDSYPDEHDDVKQLIEKAVHFGWLVRVPSASAA
jgi:hypothetical protein